MKVVHMSHSAVLGVAFAAIIGAGLGRFSDNVGATIVTGVVLWAVLAALVMPIWLAAVGFAGAPRFPNFALPGSLPAHVVYGAVLEAIYPYAKGL